MEKIFFKILLSSQRISASRKSSYYPSSKRKTHSQIRRKIRNNKVPPPPGQNEKKKSLPTLSAEEVTKQILLPFTVHPTVFFPLEKIYQQKILRDASLAGLWQKSYSETFPPKTSKSSGTITPGQSEASSLSPTAVSSYRRQIKIWISPITVSASHWKRVKIDGFPEKTSFSRITCLSRSFAWIISITGPGYRNSFPASGQILMVGSKTGQNIYRQQNESNTQNAPPWKP